ncbi:AraC family transcriptional regulator [Paracoccus sp. TOH]|uniref:helix-turn-helix domain-containing protein n=1 Tax=Paracoccus sp. TOH TaxID=1263728 RepID=UPI0025B02DEB|nr:AraC family transcriptional regulator [Paracoccus sp. TOH]WJS86992.1 AraC family transcriptional regulator [Paracoccus sp. TOH]
MSYRHSMTCHTEGIRPTTPVQWRGLDGLVSVYWQAEGQTGARGYYLSPDPRIVFFFNDVASQIRLSNRDGGIGRHCRPMTRAIYVPAGLPIWTRFTAPHAFSHLDLHVHQDRLLRFLSPPLGRSEAMAVLRRPVETQDAAAIDALARLLVDEVAAPRRHGLYAESLVGSIFGALLDLPQQAEACPAARLTPAQMKRLRARLAARPDRRLTVAEMAESVGLSDSWFAHVFKATTGTTPLQWQLGQRIGLAQRLLLDPELRLADIAAQLGFSDQAHLTRVFRKSCGTPPAAWRRARLAGQGEHAVVDVQQALPIPAGTAALDKNRSILQDGCRQDG